MRFSARLPAALASVQFALAMTQEERIACLQSFITNLLNNNNAPHLIDARATLAAFQAILDDMKERYNLSAINRSGERRIEP